ncbi:3-deoxy-manno-octulosonate cytidylyltransferase [Candidatus Blochmanniella floridana]|uniref:3-deoxy-manno-octulosonate cytidylyltransferase n=1 Tax=Blochmanniella floridana TaxID=203907 RepID=KDSB_BLOFL|nr:RecName: Full=3-deoxy-manno-octulosonate cytidylyltransferase; AltName: Full=CMP-2-keto-3-deoxyoctulosonic acid synthase; Short=CKS; Short=CMP-KDO synthase [Candidatus Blochmannia floridanus]CAD83442.1 3-deoxy-manno-octulosonate cytidylyltransferase [Candidatus Blochmannia floridanus]
MNFIIIIPARFFSSRFPGKLLADIQGKPMIIRVIEKALTTKTTKIIVATDSVSIKQIVEYEYYSFGDKVEVCLTYSDHQSGTERISEIVKRYRFADDQIIVQLQGDEPLISSYMIHQIVDVFNMTTSNNISVSTLATPIFFYNEVIDSNIVKVVVNIYGVALYFSRSMIPWMSINHDFNQELGIWLRHIGIYAYRVNFLSRYMNWIKSSLEKYEMLEQLRILWNGETIYVSVMDNIRNISVDTPESLRKVNELFLISN